MTHNDIARAVVDTAMRIHKAYGPGLLESVYQAIPVVWDEVQLEVGFRADLVVNSMVIVELKSVEVLAPVHAKILLTYLRIADKRLGLLINFGEELLKDGIRRIVNNLHE